MDEACRTKVISKLSIVHLTPAELKMLQLTRSIVWPHDSNRLRRSALGSLAKNLIWGMLIGFVLPSLAWTAERPNMVFLLSDDHSYPFVSCYGDSNVKTPNLDRLAADGMMFRRFFTAAPQCVLSRAAYMTGRSTLAARMIRFSSPLPRDEITLPELLRSEANYFTGICGRSFHLDGSNRLGKFVATVYEENQLMTFADRVDYLKKGSDSEVINQVREFLDQCPPERPFFLWANYSDPHHAWNAPEKYRPDPSELRLPDHWPDLPGMRNQLADYCAEVNRVDEPRRRSSKGIGTAKSVGHDSDSLCGR